jgi:hypothetical protein
MKFLTEMKIGFLYLSFWPKILKKNTQESNFHFGRKFHLLFRPKSWKFRTQESTPGREVFRENSCRVKSTSNALLGCRIIMFCHLWRFSGTIRRWCHGPARRGILLYVGSFAEAKPWVGCADTPTSSSYTRSPNTYFVWKLFLTKLRRLKYTKLP